MCVSPTGSSRCTPREAIDHETTLFGSLNSISKIQFRNCARTWMTGEFGKKSTGWAGSLLSLLGDHKPLRALADEFLEVASPGW